MPDHYTKVGGVWKKSNKIYTRQGGAWKEITNGYVKQSGVWKKFYSAVQPPTALHTFAGTDHAVLVYSHTYTNVPISTPAADRFVVVMLVDGNNGLSSVTIGGITATQIVKEGNTGGNRNKFGCYGAIVPTGTTANIVISSAFQGSKNAISVVVCYGLSSTTPVAVSSIYNFYNPQNGLVLSGSVNTSANGLVMGILSIDSGTSMSGAFSGLTPVGNISDSATSNYLLTGLDTNVAAATPRAISGTFTNTGTGNRYGGVLTLSFR